MWLINVTNFQLEEFFEDDVPPYGILSHTWGPEEVTFYDIREDMDNARDKDGFDKIKNCCELALQDQLQYVWIDTCCIDKRNSTELSEAINSMFGWYRQADHCYVYLFDVPEVHFEKMFCNSIWFRRGWTLQELIASPSCSFYSMDWELLGTKDEKTLREKITLATGIPDEVLTDSQNTTRMSIAQRMSWASKRETSRPEDMAYSLMGLFGVNIPILYGEGARKAFKRLQLEIIATVPDQTIFAWKAKRGDNSSGLLADSAADFASSSSIVPSNNWPTGLRPYSMTNVGMSIRLPISTSQIHPEVLMGATGGWKIDSNGNCERVCVYLQKMHDVEISGSRRPGYRRVRCDEFELAGGHTYFGRRQDIFVFEDEQFELLTLMEDARGRTKELQVNLIRITVFLAWLKALISAWLTGRMWAWLWGPVSARLGDSAERLPRSAPLSDRKSGPLIQHSLVDHQATGDGGGQAAGDGGGQAAGDGGGQAAGVRDAHALQDYQMNLMLLEQENKRRLLAAGDGGGQAAGVRDAHALQDYQMELLLLEQKKKRKLLAAGDGGGQSAGVRDAHALQDYQMELIRLEQKKKRKLLAG